MIQKINKVLNTLYCKYLAEEVCVEIIEENKN